MSKKSHYNKCIHALQTLHEKYPEESLGRHLYSALSDYGDFWGISDKELLHLLEKYSSIHEIDTIEIDIDKVIEDGKNLNLFPQEEEDYGNQ